MTRNPMPDLPSKVEGNTFFPALQKEMNRLFDQFRNGFPTPDAHWPDAFTGGAFPAIDVVQTDATIEITAEVPGVSEDDIDVSIAGDVLTIKGTKSAEHKSNQDDIHLIERRYGSFRRRIPLSFTPDNDAVKADFADGVLKLSISKPAETQAAARKIAIKKS